MKRALRVTSAAIAVAVISSAAQATCTPVEYARLKDSTKVELSDWYCNAMVDANTARKLVVISEGDIAKPNSYRDKHVAYLQVAGEAANMLKKKFKVTAPTCANAR